MVDKPPYLDLRLGKLNILKDSYVVPTFNQDTVKIFKVEYQFLDPNFVAIFQHYTGANPTNIQLFHTPPNTLNRNIHMDGSAPSDMWAINQVVSGTRNGIMRWFRSDSNKLEYIQTGITTKYNKYDISEVTETDRHIIDEISLVRIGIPHNIDNPDNDSRWCISIRPDRYHITYQELYNRFTSDILL